MVVPKSVLVDPTYCRRKILDVHGKASAQWLAGLPGLVAECAGLPFALDGSISLSVRAWAVRGVRR